MVVLVERATPDRRDVDISDTGATGQGPETEPAGATEAAAAPEGAGGSGTDAAESRQRRLVDIFGAEYVGLCRLASLLLSDPGRAEDVVQEAFLRTFSGWGRIRDKDRAPAYLRRSVVNLCRSGLRHRLVEQRGNAAVRARPEVPGWDAERQGTAMAVTDAIRRLPARQRAVVVLRYYADLPEAEIAATMGCAAGTVKSQLAKARAALALTLADHGTARPDISPGDIDHDREI